MEKSDLVQDFDEAKSLRRDKNTNLYKKIKKKIDNSDSMNQEEKQRALDQFIEDGYYTHSAPEVIDQNRKTTELKHDSEHITHDECVDKVNISHLSEAQQKLTKNMLIHCKKSVCTL